MLGLGIIGLGLALKPHALSLRELESRVSVRGAYSPSAARRQEFESAWRWPTRDSLDALLADPAVQAVLILTPPRTHFDLASRAAGAGKHVLLEKPVDVTHAEAKRLVDVVDSHRRRLGVVFQHRFRPGAIALRDILRQGELGELLSVSAAVRWWRSPAYYAQPGRGMKDRDGGGVLLTQAIHTLDLMLDLAGPAARVSARCRTSPLRRIDTEDIACATVEFQCGAIGVLDATTVATPGYPERIDIAGTRGSAVIEAERLTVHRDGRDPLVIDGATAGGGGADPMAFSHEPHKRLIEDFLEAVETGRAPMADGHSALKVHALIDAMLASSTAGTWMDLP
ncbi:MAG: Gfo/Idh/MocA family oxidoreductase [Burkholderiales bacterium]